MKYYGCAQVRGRGSQSSRAREGAARADALVDTQAKGGARGGREGTTRHRGCLPGSCPLQGQARDDAGADGGGMPAKAERSHGDI